MFVSTSVVLAVVGVTSFCKLTLQLENRKINWSSFPTQKVNVNFLSTHVVLAVVGVTSFCKLTLQLENRKISWSSLLTQKVGVNFVSTHVVLAVIITTITIYFTNPSGKLKLSFDRTTKNISQ